MSMGRRLPPCKENGADCTERRPGCQSSCEKMKRFKEESAEYKAKVKAGRERERILSGFKCQQMQKVKKYGGNRLPNEICANAVKREERRLRNAKSKVIKEPCGR